MSTTQQAQLDELVRSVVGRAGKAAARVRRAQITDVESMEPIVALAIALDVALDLAEDLAQRVVRLEQLVVSLQQRR